MQKIFKTRWVIVAIIVSIIAASALIFWYFRSNQNVLYIQIENVDFDLSGSRFVLDGVKVGTLKKDELMDQDIWIYRVDLDQVVHIPINSFFSLIKDSQSRIIVDVELSPGGPNYKLGDTITQIQVDSDLPSALVVGNEVEIDGKEEIAELEPKEKIEIRLQLIASKTKLKKNSIKFNGLDQIKEFEEDGWFKYYLGPFESLDDARAKKKEIANNGFKDAFIVAYRGNERISISELKK